MAISIFYNLLSSSYLGTEEHPGPGGDDHQEVGLGLEGRGHREAEQQVGEDGAGHAGQDDAGQGGQRTVPDHDRGYSEQDST